MSYHLDPIDTALVCDHPGCDVRIVTAGHGWAEKRSLVRVAEQDGWQLGAYGERPEDRCPGHVGVNAALADVGPLYTEDERRDVAEQLADNHEVPPRIVVTDATHNALIERIENPRQPTAALRELFTDTDIQRIAKAVADELAKRGTK